MKKTLYLILLVFATTLMSAKQNEESNIASNSFTEAHTPTDYEVCDSGADLYDGVASFDLTTKDEEVYGDDIDPETVILTYHLSEEEASSGANPIDASAPFSNTSNPQTIWVRLENIETGCFNMVHFDLVVDPVPNANFEPNPVALCDNDDDGDDTNGFVSGFDLNEAALDILNGQVGTSLVFYSSYEVALDENAAFIIDYTLPYNNTVAFDQTIWAVVTDNLSDLTCKAYVPLHLIVNPLPEITNISTHVFCEEDDDGELLADLHEMDIFIVANPDDLEFLDITYYSSFDNANVPINQIDDEFYLTEPTVFYARIENIETGCYRVAGGIVASVAQKPEAFQPEDLHQYDDDTDGDNTNGIGVSFDLTSQTSTIEDGQTDVATTYYLSETDAVLEDSLIDTPNNFINTVNHQEIWARVENTVGCYNTTMFHLIVDEVTSTDSYVFYDKDYLPFFTPNNDGYNDYWHLVGLDTQEKAKIHIYTKSGKLITKIDARSEGWDGKLNGKLMPATDYWFAVLLEDNSMKTGHFSLIID